MKSVIRALGITGTILIVFGVIAWVITRLMNWYVYLHLGLGVVFIIVYGIFYFDAFVDRIKHRSTAEGSKVFLYSAIFLLIIIVLNIISFRKSVRWDLTDSGIHSLEEQSIKVLKNLQAPLKVSGFFHAKNPRRQAFKEFLETYAYQSDQVEFELIDPDKRPAYANRFQVKDGDIRLEYGREDAFLPTYDEKKVRNALQGNVKKVFYFSENGDDPGYKKLTALLNTPEFKEKGVVLDLRKPEQGGPPSMEEKPTNGALFFEYLRKNTVIQDLSEQAITNAIIQIGRQDNPVVYFSTGRGERSISDEDERGFSILSEAIKNEGYEVQTMKKSLVHGVPSDADILVLAGPTGTFTEPEANSVRKFLNAGGKVILLADPNITNPKLNKVISFLDTGLEKVLAEWGVEIGKDIVFEHHLQLLAGQTVDPVVIARDYGTHIITNPLRRGSTYFDVTRSVGRSKEVPDDISLTELIKSAPGNNSWAERNINALVRQNKFHFDDGKDLPGPVPIAIVAEKQKKGGSQSHSGAKLAVFGDADFVSNKHIRTEELNYDLFLNTLNWMWGKKEQIAIRPKRLRSSKLLLTQKQTNIIFYSAVLSIPELILILGLAVYWRRRSR